MRRTEFINDASVIGRWETIGWTKGRIFLHYGGDEPILSYRYDVRTIDDKKYLFVRLNCKEA